MSVFARAVRALGWREVLKDAFGAVSLIGAWWAVDLLLWGMAG